MLTNLIEFSLRNRFLVLTITALICGLGIWSALHLPIDAVPDMTNTQVTVVTEAGSLSPIQVENFVTYPVEQAMAGLPKVEEIRSISRFGISVVTIVFHEGTNLYLARQLVTERLTIAGKMSPPSMVYHNLVRSLRRWVKFCNLKFVARLASTRRCNCARSWSGK